MVERKVPRDQMYELKALTLEIQLIELQCRQALQDRTRRKEEILGLWEQVLGGKVLSVDFEKGMAEIGTADTGNPEELGTRRLNGGGGGAIPEIHAGISAGISPELDGDRGEPYVPLPPCDGRVDEGGEQDS